MLKMNTVNIKLVHVMNSKYAEGRELGWALQTSSFTQIAMLVVF